MEGSRGHPAGTESIGAQRVKKTVPLLARPLSGSMNLTFGAINGLLSELFVGDFGEVEVSFFLVVHVAAGEAQHDADAQQKERKIPVHFECLLSVDWGA